RPLHASAQTPGRLSLLAALPGSGLARHPGRPDPRARWHPRLDPAGGLVGAGRRRRLVLPDAQGARLRLQGPPPAGPGVALAAVLLALVRQPQRPALRLWVARVRALRVGPDNPGGPGRWRLLGPHPRALHSLDDRRHADHSANEAHEG